MAADTGAIGGDRSALSSRSSPTPARTPSYLPDSDYAANIELAGRCLLLAPPREPRDGADQDADARQGTCEDVATLLGAPLATHGEVAGWSRPTIDERASPAGVTVWLLVRGDHALNEVKAGKLPGLEGGFRFATEAEILEHFGCKPGYLGPSV